MTEAPRSIVATAAEALRANPLVVGVLLLNVLFVVGALWYLTHVESQHSEYLKLILERCLPKGSP
jgi:hypothetical protein